MAYMESWHSQGSALARRGRNQGTDPGDPDPGGGGRDSLVYGDYEPDATTAGVPAGTVLTDYNSPATNAVTIPNGALITDKRIYGDVTFAGSAELFRCELVGGNNTITSGNVGILRCTNTRTGIAKLTDCTIKPRQESNGRDCALGKQYELYRCHLSGGIDGCGIYSTSTTAPNCDVKVYGCLIEDLTYVYPDTITTSHTDGTHNDCIQIQGGRNIHILGNSLRGTAHALTGTGSNPQKPWLIGQGYNNGAVLIVQNNTGAGIDNTVLIEKNWLRGGLAHFNIKPAMTFLAPNNKHYRATAVQSGTWSGYWTRFDQRSGTNVPGLTSGISSTWVDGPYAGQLLAEPRDRGIHYNV